MDCEVSSEGSSKSGSIPDKDHNSDDEIQTSDNEINEIRDIELEVSDISIFELENNSEDYETNMIINNKSECKEILLEINELKSIVDEQYNKVRLYESNYEKIISERKNFQDKLEKEQQNNEMLLSEKEAFSAEKRALENDLSNVKRQLELAEEEIQIKDEELEKLRTHQTSNEERIIKLSKQKMELERETQNQADEIIKYVAQMQWLEKIKTKMELSIINLNKRADIKNQEIEDLKETFQTKIKSYEEQLKEHEKINELCRKELNNLEKKLKTPEPSELKRMKNEMKKMKILIKDLQLEVDQYRTNVSSETIIQQMKNQLQDLECARAIAVKAKHSLETDLFDMQFQLEETIKQKKIEEDRVASLMRERTDLMNYIDENEEEINEIIRKFEETKNDQKKIGLAKKTTGDASGIPAKTGPLENIKDCEPDIKNLILWKVYEYELHVNELISKLKVEQMNKSRLEIQNKRLKEALERVKNDLMDSKMKEQQKQDQLWKLQQQLKDIKEEFNKNAVLVMKKEEMQKRCEIQEVEISVIKNELKVYSQRIDELQAALEEQFDNVDAENSDSEPERPSTTSDPEYIIYKKFTQIQ
ncbi:unnamed protein product [Phyllotreta striolata]|uniref:Uncharacterized protein n=1 Tax=Phyllotreta striolata TaxID=444603 RepID=A0A9N9TW19_PHYSR|nr:unnamed protein product [Phyllotreta striolata]